MKARARGEQQRRGEPSTGDGPSASAADDTVGQLSALVTLRTALSWLLRMFAPFLPFVTEEAWSWSFAGETGRASIHRASWPAAEEVTAVTKPADRRALAVASAALSAIHKKKTLSGRSMAAPVERVELQGDADTLAVLDRVLGDVLSAGRLRQTEVRRVASGDSLAGSESTIDVTLIEFGPGSGSAPEE